MKIINGKAMLWTAKAEIVKLAKSAKADIALNGEVEPDLQRRAAHVAA